MRIFGWSADPATAYWRLHLPLGELAKGGHDVMISDVMPPCVQHSEVDVLVASRTANAGASAVFRRLAGEARMLCVYEADDDFLSVTPDNRQAHAFFARPAVRADILANLAAAHLVTVSTEHLADVVSRHTGAPVVVLPNRVPRWLTDLEPSAAMRQRHHLVAGYTGGASHVRDFGECAKPLRAWLQRHGDVEFHAIGQDHTPRVATIRGRTRHTGWSRSVPAYLRSIDFDIGVAPLRDTLFARSKSPLKLLEYGALGIPAIASPVGPYATGEPGRILARRPGEWRDALEQLRADPQLRHELGVAGRLWACEHLVEDHAHEWLDAYQTALAGREAA